MSNHPDDLSDADLIEAIYAGVLDGHEMERAIRAATSRIDASGGNLHIIGTKSLETRYFVGFGEGYTEEAISAFLDHWQYANVHRFAMRRAYEKHGASVYLCHQHISEDDWQRAAYLQEFFAKIGQRWLAGGMLRPNDEIETSVTFSRRLGSEHFGDNEGRFIQQLLPHIKGATGLAMKLGRLGAAAPISLTAGLMIAQTPSAMVTADGSIVWANPSGLALIEECSLIVSQRDRLAMRQPNDESLFKRALARAINKQVLNAGPERLSLVSDQEVYELEILPASLPSGALAGAVSVALIMFRKRGLTVASAARLQFLFGFTEAEANLAILVANGLSIDQAADARGVKSSTVRAQLRSVFAKADVSRANALAAKVWAVS